jgi:hypothetical protein
MEDPEEFQKDLFPVLDRLVKGGFATGWRYAPEKIHVDWDPDFEGGLGGQAAFQGLVHLLLKLCEEQPLSETDQAMLVSLDAAWRDEHEGW